MRPLLLLSEDPVSRKFGDKALLIYEAFVSGDHKGVLAQLGREYDTKLLSDADVRLMNEMVEDLEGETDARRNNAAAVLAALGDRYPESTAHLLLSPLARRLAESADLRCRIGVANIGRVLPSIGRDDRRAVAACLIDDLLKSEGKIDFRLETGETPSLDEAEDLAWQACSLVLEVRSAGQLDDRHDSALLNWLESRRVSILDRDASLPFADFESWMSQHETWLLPALSERYTNLVLEQLEDRAGNDVVIDEAVRRCRIIFDKLFAAGEESRKQLWEQMARFVALKEPAFVFLAADVVVHHVVSPDEAAISIFAGAFANRLAHESSSEATTGFDLLAFGSVFVEIVTKRSSALQPTCEAAVADLVAKWSQRSDTAHLAADLLSALCRQFTGSSNVVIEQWTERLLSNLPSPCIDWLAQSFVSVLSDQQRHSVAGKLEKAVKPDDLSEPESIQYGRFVSSLSENGLSTAELRGHLQALINAIRQLFSLPSPSPQANPAQRNQQEQHRRQKIATRKLYLRHIFGTIPRRLQYADKASVGSMLSELFSSAKSDPPLFGWLHQQMADFWPTPAEESPEYDVGKVFSDAVEVAAASPAEPTSTGPLRTATSMVTQHLVANDRATAVVNAACKLWHHHPADAIETLKSIDAVPETESLVAMIDDVNPNDDVDVVSLTDAWVIVAARMTNAGRINTGIALLSKPAKGAQNEPDLCLRLWIHARNDDRQQLLEALITAHGLNDNQRKRVWLQIERAEEVGDEFLGRVLPKIAGFSENPQTVSALLDFEGQITAKATSKHKLYSLGQRIVEAFRASSSVEAKNRFAEWLKRLEVDGVLNELAKYGEMSEDEIGILDGHFAKSKQWKKVRSA
jgi:hypothetical protein